MNEKEKRAETTPVCFLIGLYFILPDCRKRFKALLSLWSQNSSPASFSGGGGCSGCCCFHVPVAVKLSQRPLLQAAIQDSQFAILAKSIYWKLMRHKQFMHFEADLPNEMNGAQSAGKINDAKMHFSLALLPAGVPATSHSIVLMLLWQFWLKLLQARPGELPPHPGFHMPRGW